MKRLNKLLLILCFALFANSAFADSTSQTNCNNITTEAEHASCSYSGEASNFMMNPMEKMWMSEPVAALANLGANILFTNSENTQRFQSHEHKASALTNLTDKIPQVISFLFVIRGMWVFLRILNSLRRTGGADKRNNGFLMLNLVFSTIGQGLNGKYYMLCAVMFIGMYGAEYTAMTISPLYIDAAVHDEAAIKSRAMNKVNVMVPPFYAAMIKAHIDDLTIRKPLFMNYSTTQNVGTGKFSVVASVNVSDKEGKNHVYNNYAECISKSVGEPYFKGNVLVDAEMNKTTDCVKQTGARNAEHSSFYYMGDRVDTKSIIIDADKSAREVAQMFVELTCSTNLNTHDNRTKYADNILVYQQCVDLSSKGVPVLDGQNVGLVNSSVSVKDLTDRIKADSARLTQAFSPMVEEMISKKEVELDTANGFSTDITSLLYVITRAYSKEDVNSELQNEFDKMHFAQNSGFSMNSAAAAMIGLDVDDLQDAAKTLTDTAMPKKAVQKLVDFDRGYQYLIAQNLNANLSLKQATGIVANFMTNDFFEVTGYTSTDCLSMQKGCVVAALNQAAAQHATGVQAVKDLAWLHGGLTAVRVVYDTERSLAKSRNAYPVITDADVAIRRIDMALGWIKNSVTFFVITMLIKDNVFVFVVVSNLLFWLYGFWPTLIVMTRSGLVNMAPNNDEIGKASKNIEAIKQMFWLLIAPSLYVAMFFINQGLYSYGLTIEGSGVASMSNLITFGGGGVLNEFINQIRLYIIHTVVATVLPFTIIIMTNKIPRKLEKMFNVAHNDEGDKQAMQSAQHVEHKIEQAIKSGL